MAESFEPAASATRIQALDGLRGIAILLVVVGHSLRPDFFTDVSPTAVDQAWALVLSYGWAGVDLFFVLSGYLITGILLASRDEPHYFRNFYARRALRIFPLYYLVIGVVLFGLRNAPYTGSELLAYLSYWSNLWLAAHPENAQIDVPRVVAWSLAIEEQFYLCWPLLVWFAPRRALPWICAVMILGALMLRFALHAQHVHGFSIYVLTPCRVDALAAGALLAATHLLPARAARLLAVLAMAVLAYVFHLQGHAMATGQAMQTWGFTCNIALAASALSLCRRDGLFAAICRNRVLCTFGRYSYAMYLTHVLVMDRLSAWMLVEDGPLALKPMIRSQGTYLPAALLFAAIALVATTAVAWLSWHLFEKHLLALKRFFPSHARRAS